MEPWQFEALSWLVNSKNRQALAANRFQTTKEAIEAVKRLYAAGAIEVRVGPVIDEPERIKREGGPHADTLVVTFPKGRIRQVLAVAKSLEPDVTGDLANEVYLDDETHSHALMLKWD